MLVKDLQFFDKEYFFKNFRMDTRTFEDLLSWITAVIQKSFIRRSHATPVEVLCVTLLYLTFQNTPEQLIQHEEADVDSHPDDKTVSEKKNPYSTVTKFWINFTCRLVAGSHAEKSC